MHNIQLRLKSIYLQLNMNHIERVKSSNKVHNQADTPIQNQIWGKNWIYTILILLS